MWSKFPSVKQVCEGSSSDTLWGVVPTTFYYRSNQVGVVTKVNVRLRYDFHFVGHLYGRHGDGKDVI